MNSYCDINYPYSIMLEKYLTLNFFYNHFSYSGFSNIRKKYKDRLWSSKILFHQLFCETQSMDKFGNWSDGVMNWDKKKNSPSFHRIESYTMHDVRKSLINQMSLFIRTSLLLTANPFLSGWVARWTELLRDRNWGQYASCFKSNSSEIMVGLHTYQPYSVMHISLLHQLFLLS